MEGVEGNLAKLGDGLQQRELLPWDTRAARIETERLVSAIDELCLKHQDSHRVTVQFSFAAAVLPTMQRNSRSERHSRRQSC